MACRVNMNIKKEYYLLLRICTGKTVMYWISGQRALRWFWYWMLIYR